ncbi:MAG: beta-propeller fold lactonase family protein [Terracidiphilus sp.]|jgi:6-phosphogluconolactonase (cycloisomerase 2 family)
MKFSKLSQLFLVSIIGLVVAALLTSCNIVTIDYLFVASSSGSGAGSAGQIQTYDLDEGSGALRPGQANVPSGGVNPVSMAVAPDYTDLYVANQGNNSVVHFAVSGSGVLTDKDTVTTAATPVSIAVSPASSYLYVVSGTSSATLTAYPLSSGAIGSPVATIPLTLATVSPGFAADTIVPTGVNVLANGNAVFVTAYDQSAYNPGGSVSSNANPGWVFGFTVGSGGALTPATGSPWKAGVKPTAITSDPTNRFVYVTDFASNELIGYTVQNGNVLDFMVNGPFKTGNEPSAITIDPRGLYIYVSNALDSSVSAYTIALSTGTPSAAVNTVGSQTNSTDTQPVAILIDQSLGRYVYTANHLGDSVSGFELNPNTGALTQTISTPYPTGAAPAALATIPHGNHATQSVTP